MRIAFYICRIIDWQGKRKDPRHWRIRTNRSGVNLDSSKNLRPAKQLMSDHFQKFLFFAPAYAYN